MKIVFKKIPKLAQYFYLIGALLIIVALSNLVVSTAYMKNIEMQQLFIIGAIIVAIGSVINTFYQFRKNK